MAFLALLYFLEIKHYFYLRRTDQPTNEATNIPISQCMEVVSRDCSTTHRWRNCAFSASFEADDSNGSPVTSLSFFFFFRFPAMIVVPVVMMMRRRNAVVVVIIVVFTPSSNEEYPVAAEESSMSFDFDDDENPHERYGQSDRSKKDAADSQQNEVVRSPFDHFPIDEKIGNEFGKKEHANSW